MTAENDRYNKVMEILRNSRPGLIQPEGIENEVIKRIQHKNKKPFLISDFIESLFGWVYIGWVRRSLIGAAMILIAIFIYQQANILKQVNNISKQVVIIGNEQVPFYASALDKRLTLYKMSARFSAGNKINISKRQLEELIDSYNELQVKYKDLLRIIETDPDLKNYIEKKLKQEKDKKPYI